MPVSSLPPLTVAIDLTQPAISDVTSTGFVLVALLPDVEKMSFAEVPARATTNDEWSPDAKWKERPTVSSSRFQTITTISSPGTLGDKSLVKTSLGLPITVKSHDTVRSI